MRKLVGDTPCLNRTNVVGMSVDSSAQCPTARAPWSGTGRPVRTRATFAGIMIVVPFEDVHFVGPMCIATHSFHIGGDPVVSTPICELHQVRNDEFIVLLPNPISTTTEDYCSV